MLTVVTLHGECRKNHSKDEALQKDEVNKGREGRGSKSKEETKSSLVNQGREFQKEFQKKIVEMAKDEQFW